MNIIESTYNAPIECSGGHMFEAFMGDAEALDMYITGAAGTGKTHGLATHVNYCITHDINYVVCAYTHRACNVLRDKLPHNAKVCTLHSYLKKRPTINEHAVKEKHIETSKQQGQASDKTVIFVDEYSIVGERDVMSLRDLDPTPKIVWIGDPHQLPPVDDAESVRPYGEYQQVLTKRWRTGDDSPLQDPLDQLISFIEGAEPAALIENDKLIRGCDIVDAYKQNPTVILAFTNRRVQDLNSEVQGYTTPVEGDTVFCPTNRETYTFKPATGTPQSITVPGNNTLRLGSKYKTLEYLARQGYSFTDTLCYVFGHQEYNEQKKKLMRAAAAANQAIPSDKPTEWARANSKTKLAKDRATAWRAFLAFNNNVVCLDFAHAMTVHKSQGSTYHTVYVDTDDIGVAANIDYTLYLKLMYVAISRASCSVITN